MRKIIFTFICLSIAAMINSAPTEDLVDNLYGDLYKGEVYSGYLDTVDAKRKLHYVYVPSQNNPLKDPIVLWLNGGPGCSSMLGLFMENGPVVLEDYDPEWRVNDYSWNKIANMLYIEAPAGVGFSYSKNDPEDLKSNDDKTAKDSEKAVVNFFRKFPEYARNDFYISGESYAGVYVPWLARQILLNQPRINLKGILVGNGLTDVQVDVEEGLIDFAYQHTLFSPEVYEQFNLYCSSSSSGKLKDFNPKNVTRACNEVRTQIRNSLQGLNVYDIYRDCPASEDSSKVHAYQKATINNLKRMSLKKRMEKLTLLMGEDFNEDEDLEPEVGIWPNGCAEDLNLGNFLNNSTTKEKLHVEQSINWLQCNNEINESYAVGDASFSIYRDELIKRPQFKTWFYTGDTDAAVPYTGSIKWIPNLKMNITEEYRSWVVDRQTVGYVQTYQNNFKYITIKGTGHMAPQWKRPEAFVMFSAFLNGENLPTKK